MSTIRLLESKNDELLKQRKEVVDNYERDLMTVKTFFSLLCFNLDCLQLILSTQFSCRNEPAIQSCRPRSLNCKNNCVSNPGIFSL